MPENSPSEKRAELMEALSKSIRSEVPEIREAVLKTLSTLEVRPGDLPLETLQLLVNFELNQAFETHEHTMKILIDSGLSSTDTLLLIVRCTEGCKNENSRNRTVETLSRHRDVLLPGVCAIIESPDESDSARRSASMLVEQWGEGAIEALPALMAFHEDGKERREDDWDDDFDENFLAVLYAIAEIGPEAQGGLQIATEAINSKSEIHQMAGLLCLQRLSRDQVDVVPRSLDEFVDALAAGEMPTRVVMSEDSGTDSTLSSVRNEMSAMLDDGSAAGLANEMFSQFDNDGDRVLSSNELRRTRSGNRILESADRNNDRKITRNELILYYRMNN